MPRHFHDSSRTLNFRRHVIAADLEYEPHAEIKTGERVLIITGPLRGVEGVVTGHLSPDRLTVNVGKFGQSLSVGVNRNDLQRTDEPQLPFRG